MLYTGCTEGSVRLVGGWRDTEGTVEVCYDNLWGLIAANDWDDDDSSVVCSPTRISENWLVAIANS